MDYSAYKQLEFRRKFWKLVGAEISITDPHGQQEVGYIRMKAWKLREDIRILRNRTDQQAVVQIRARQIIDIGATYDVTDSSTQQLIFSARRKGLKSIFVRDHWDLLDASGNTFGELQETSSGLALARRWLELLPLGEFIALIFAFVPQTYVMNATQPDGSKLLIGTILHRKNPVVVKMNLDTSGAQTQVNPYLPMAMTALLSIVEASKNS